MSYVTEEARQELLDTIAEATDELAAALAALGDAYEHLDEAGADRLEDELFRPLQTAYGRAKRTHDAFAARHGFPVREFKPGEPGRPSAGVKELLEQAVDALEQSESILVELQDSMSPVQVGDAELRAGLAEVRTLIAQLTARSERFVNLFGR